MSITGSNNPFACEPVVFANANSIVSLGTITRDGNEFTFSVGFVWKINGVTYQNAAPVVLTIAEASEGFQRIDNALLNTSNTIELQQGLESDTIALRPVAPETNIILTSWNISGNSVGDIQSPVVGGDFKKKIENTRYKSTLSGENVIIPFQATGQSHYSVTHAALVSVAGFTTAGLTTPMYEGQDVIFENQTGHDITLKDSFGVDTSFVIGVDLIVPNEGKIWFRFRNNELELIDKNWFGIQEVVTSENLGEFIDGLDSKTDIKDVDEFIISDSEDLLKSKKTRFLDLKTKLKSYFDTFYLSLSVFDDFVEAVFDSLDNKQNKLTETNFGQFMDVDLATKLTPSVNDTFVGRDSLTNESVEFSMDYIQPKLTNPITGTGANGQVAFFNGATTQTGDNGLFWDNTNKRLGIATNLPQARLDVKAQGALATDIVFRVRNSTDTRNFLVVNGAGDVYNNGAGGVNSNTFFGENVGRSTTGTLNTAIGASALESNTTGTQNTAIGASSLFSNTTGTQNTAIGASSLQRNTTGGSNTVIGQSALFFNTTGGSNTVIGLDAGRRISDGSNQTIANNSIFIGFDTRALADNQTNQIVIGHQAIGLGSNSVVLGNTSITRTQLRGQVIMGSFASAPTGIEGAIYYNSTGKKHYGFNGTTWNALY